MLSAPGWGQPWLSLRDQALGQPQRPFQPDYTSLSPGFFLSFLCTAQFSLLPARIAKTPQWSWREMPGLEHDPTACFSVPLKWPRPHKNFFPYGGREKRSCSQEPATNSQGALCQEEIFFCLPAFFPELCQAD